MEVCCPSEGLGFADEYSLASMRNHKAIVASFTTLLAKIVELIEAVRSEPVDDENYIGEQVHASLCQPHPSPAIDFNQNLAQGFATDPSPPGMDIDGVGCECPLFYIGHWNSVGRAHRNLGR